MYFRSAQAGLVTVVVVTVAAAAVTGAAVTIDYPITISKAVTAPPTVAVAAAPAGSGRP